MTPKNTAWAWTAAVVGALGLTAFYTRLKPGNTVEVLASNLQSAGGVPLPAGALDPNLHVAVQLMATGTPTLMGTITGAVIDGKINPLPIGAVTVNFPKSSVIKKLS